jgi:hypothetical protein
MKILGIPRSGRDKNYVYYLRGRTLCRRRYVRPRDPRTPAQILARAAFGAASKMWSQNGRLREEQRQAWRGAGAKIQSRPRLFQSGPLSGQQLFVGRGSVLLRLGRELRLDVTRAVASITSAVDGLSLSYDGGRMRIKLRVPGPVVGDVMVFGAAPCSVNRKQWRTGAWLGLLPAPVMGESDITAMYVAKYGEPEPGRKVFIRIRGQRSGWKGGDTVLGEVVPAKPAPVVTRGTTPASVRISLASRSIPATCAMHMGVSPEQYRTITVATPSQHRPSTLHRRKAGRAVPSAPRSCKHLRPVQVMPKFPSALGTARPAWGCLGEHARWALARPRRNGLWRELWRGS